MKSAIIALCVFATAYATLTDQTAKVLSETYTQNPDGSFVYGYETDNGIQGRASANLKAVGKDEIALVVNGDNQYRGNDGTVYYIEYTADENGYRPRGAHLPTPPPPEAIPEYILRSLEYIKAHPYVEKKL